MIPGDLRCRSLLLRPKKIMKQAAWTIFLSLTAYTTAAQLPDSTTKSAHPNFTAGPSQAVFHTEDITTFWKIFDATYPKLSASQFQEHYIHAGSMGLQAFVRNRIESGKKLSKTIKKNLAYYQSVRQTSLSVETRKPELYECFNKFKTLYPPAIFPDVYFVVGRNNAGGTAFPDGLVMGIEKFAPYEGKTGLSINDLNTVVTHELIHFHQTYPRNNTLLAQCIREGAADFIAELITGTHTNKETYAYGNAHETQLWQEFMTKKDSNDWSNWLYYQKDKSRPKDLGYWIGYKIVKAYYNKASDKSAAIKDILTITDFNKFLTQSGYPQTDQQPLHTTP